MIKLKQTVFIGYGIPEAFDVKLEYVLPIFDKQFESIDLGGDIVHIIDSEAKLKFCEDVVTAFNALYDIDLSIEVEPYRD